MYRLLRDDGTVRGTKFSPTLNRLLKQQMKSVTIAQDYYRYFAPAVNSKHPLVKLIYALSFSMDSSPESVFKRTDELSESLALVGGISTSVQTAKGRIGTFYPNAVNYMVLDRQMRFKEAMAVDMDNWMTLTPLRCLYQPYDLDPGYLPLGGKGRTAEYDAVIGVDINALAVMYSQWTIVNNRRPTGEREAVEQFISRYVLTNLLVSQVNSVLFNMVTVIGGGSMPPPLSGKQGIHIERYNDVILEALGEHLNRLFLTNLSPYALLANLPSITEDVSLVEVLPLVKAIDGLGNYPIRLLAIANLVNTLLLITMDYSDRRKLKNSLRTAMRKIKPRRPAQRLEKRSALYLTDKIASIQFLLE